MDPGQPWKAVRYRLIPLDDWTDNVFGSMTCGTHEDDYPVVVG